MYTKIISSKRNISDIRDYLQKDKKDKEKTRNVMETKLNCFEENWASEMEDTAIFFGKNDGVKYHQIILSSDPSQVPPVNVKTVHQAGVEVAKIFANKGFQTVVETHNDTEQIHDHIVVCAVNAQDGHKLQISRAKTAERAQKADFRFIEITSKVDEICKKYGLMTLTESKAKKTEKQKRLGEQPTNQLNIYVKDSYQRTIQTALSSVWQEQDIVTQEQFAKSLDKKGIRIARITKKGKITYQDAAGHKVRADRLGAFNRADITNLIDINKDLEEERKEKERRERERQEQAARETADKKAAIEKAKAEKELQKRLEQAQLAAAAAEAEKAKKEQARKQAKEKLIKDINAIMNSGFTTTKGWKLERQKRRIHISNENDGNIIYWSEDGASLSSRDYPAYSKQSVISRAAENKIKEEKRESTKAVTKNKGRSR